MQCKCNWLVRLSSESARITRSSERYREQRQSRVISCSALSPRTYDVNCVLADSKDAYSAGAGICLQIVLDIVSAPEEAQHRHQDYNAEEEPQVVGRAVVVNLIHLDCRIEERQDERDRRDDAVPQPQQDSRHRAA